MSREEFIGKLQMVYVGDRNAFNDIVCAYDSVLSANEKAIEYINCNKQKTICAYGDNEDDDFEICLWEEDIDNLLNILQNGGDDK